MYNDVNEHIYNAILFDNNVDVGQATMHHNHNLQILNIVFTTIGLA